jgi:hypothetical protein
VVRQILVSLSILFLACRSSDMAGYTEANDLPYGYLGKSYRAWLTGSSLFVEVEQIPALNVADIECTVASHDLHFSPTRISSGGRGKTTFEVPLPSSQPADFWAGHLFWVTSETFTPIWLGRPTKPTERVRILLVPTPSNAQEVRRPTSGCS